MKGGLFLEISFLVIWSMVNIYHKTKSTNMKDPGVLACEIWKEKKLCMLMGKLIEGHVNMSMEFWVGFMIKQ